LLSQGLIEPMIGWRFWRLRGTMPRTHPGTLYELAYRPQWVHIPLTDLRELLEVC
jgi:hypothetical protein